MSHLLQTDAWGQLKSEFGWRAERVAGLLVLFRRLPLGLSLAYVPRAPLPEAGQRATLDAAARARRAVFLKVEPEADDTPEAAAHLGELGFRPSPQTIQPRRSLVLDLSGDEDTILARMKQKTRYNIRLAEKKDVRVRQATASDLPAFNALMAETGRRDAFGVHTPAYYERAFALFGPDACLTLAELEGRPLAGVMAFVHGDQAFYLYGASSDHERQRMAPYLAQWEAIRWAKTRGAERYDLWGVPDADAPALEAGFEARRDGLWGVYRFKRGWGGALTRTIGAWDRVYNPALYAVYRLYLRGRRETVA